MMLSDEMQYRLLKLLEGDPMLSQRDLARELNLSVGKVNYCLKALIARGWVKAANFKNSRNKIGYMYLLTPRGLNERARVAVRFLNIKMQEYQVLATEIERIRGEVMRDAAMLDATRSRN